MQDSVNDITKSIFSHCNGGPDCKCETCEAKRKTGFSVSDTIKATFSVCKGFHNGCECSSCQSKRRTGVNGFLQDPIDLLVSLEDTKKNFE